MAFNNGFPVTYQQYAQAQQQYFNPTPQGMYTNYPQQAQQNTMQPTNSDIIWVQGETGAKSYLVAKNSAIALWDSESPVIYIKSVDASGVPSMVVLDYKMREPEKQEDKSKKELDELKAKLDMIISELGIGSSKEVGNE